MIPHYYNAKMRPLSLNIERKEVLCGERLTRQINWENCRDIDFYKKLTFQIPFPHLKTGDVFLLRLVPGSNVLLCMKDSDSCLLQGKPSYF